MAATMGVRIRLRSLWAKPDASTFVYEFAQSRIVVGRGRSADVRLPHLAVSPTHMSIRAKEAGYVVVDEASTNGTRVNETRLIAGRPRPLRNHDQIDVGGFHLTLEVGVPVAKPISLAQSTRYAIDLLAEDIGEQDEGSLQGRLAALESEPDRIVELLPLPEDAKPAPTVTPPSEPTQAPQTPRALSRGEIAVFALAGTVIAICVAAIFVLIQMS